MPRPMFVVHGISARERYDGVAANLFEVENERDFELFKKQCLTFVKAGNLYKLQELISKWKKNRKVVCMNFQDPESGDTPLMMAVVQNHKQMLLFLLNQDVDLTLRNKDMKTAVHIANEDLRTIMLSGKFNTDLRHAAWLGNASGVVKMLRKQININERNSEGMTPLSLATRDINFFEKLPQMKNYEPLKVVKTLLEHNAEILLCDLDGKTAMHHLVENTGLMSREITEALLCKAKKMDTADRKETTPLHTAAKLGDVRIVEMLLESGSSILSRSSDGKTPLHYSVINGHTDITRLLVKWNADVNAVDDRGKTPWDLAKEQNNQVLLNVLRQSSIRVCDSSEESEDDGESSPKSQSSLILSTTAKSRFPPVITSRRNKSNRVVPEVNAKKSSKPQLYKLPNLEFHARPSASSPTLSSHRARSAKKTVSLPSSFKFEDATQQYLEDEYPDISEGNSISGIPISQSGTLGQMLPEPMAVSLDSNLNSTSAGNSFQEGIRSIETSQFLFSSNSSGACSGKGSAIPRGELSSNYLDNQTLNERHSSHYDKQTFHWQQNPFSDDELRQVALHEDRLGKMLNDDDSFRNPDWRLSLEREQSSFEDRGLSGNGFEPRITNSDGKGRRLLSDHKVLSEKSNDYQLGKLAKCGQVLEKDASSSGLENVYLDPKGSDNRRPSSIIRGSISKRMPPAPLSNCDTSLLQMESIVPQDVESKVRDLKSDHILGGESVYSSSSVNSFQGLNESATHSIMTKRKPEARESNEAIADDICGASSPSGCNFPSLCKEETFYPMTLKQPEELVAASGQGLVPPLDPHTKLNPSKNLNGKHHNPCATSPQRRSTERDGSAKKIVEANVVRVYLPDINTTLSGRHRKIQSYDIRRHQVSKQSNMRNQVEEKNKAKNVNRSKENSIQLQVNAQKNTFAGITDYFPGSSIVATPPSSSSFSSTTEYTSSNLPKEDNDLPTSCSESPPFSIGGSSSVIGNDKLSPLDTSFTGKIQAQLSVVQESSCEYGSNANDNEHDVTDPNICLGSSVNSLLDSSLNLSVTIPMGCTATSNELYDLEDRETVRLAEHLQKIVFEKELEPLENIDSSAHEVRISPENSSSENFFKELTEIAFAPGVNSAISNVPSQRISRRSSLVRSSICTQTSFDGSDCCEDELHDWKKGTVIDKGANGTVYRGMTNRGKLVAVKEVDLNKSDKKKAEITYGKLQEEIEMLKSLKHRYIVKFIGTIMQDNVVDIFMEYIPGGSLALALKQFGPFTEKVFRRFTRQILSAVSYIHQSGIVHRDIKGANIMLTSGGVVKLIDFGCAKQMKRSLKSNSDLLRSCEGTPYWMAPEVIRGVAYGAESDVWSVGCTVFEMATGNPPWTGNEYAAMYAIGSKQSPIPELPCEFSQDARDFVARCLVRNQMQRATARQLMKHRFVKSHRVTNNNV